MTDLPDYGHAAPDPGCLDCLGFWPTNPGPARKSGPSRTGWRNELPPDLAADVEDYHGWARRHHTLKGADSDATYVAEGLVRMRQGERRDWLSSHVRSGLKAYDKWLDLGPP